jgi:exopolysaccharide biosynthesis polyprenyl glycosylphosphotransferase
VLFTGSIAVARLVVRSVVRRLRKRGIGLRRTIIIGDSARSQQLLDMFTHSPELGYQVVGTVPTGIDASPEFARLSLGGIDEIDAIINTEQIEVTVIATERDRAMLPKLMTETAVADTTIKIVPDLYDLVSGQTRAQHLYGVPLIEINAQIMEPWQRHMKRLLDIVFSLAVLVLGLPAWFVVAIIIKLEDHGPIFYSQERVGLGGRKFMMHKFRSMRIDAEKAGITWTAVNDPRVTRLGQILRKLHLDEIPQFWNVLVGDMSIVGPRPERPYYVEKFTEMIPAYPRRLRVKPGVTGWNQVHIAEIVETVEFLQERLRHDFFYIENVSLRLDIEIIVRTIIRVIQRKGQA